LTKVPTVCSLVSQPTIDATKLAGGEALSKSMAENPFTEQTLNRDISLSCYSTPTQVIRRRPRPQTANDVLLKRVPGWKPPKEKTECGPDGEPIPCFSSEYIRESVLPDF